MYIFYICRVSICKHMRMSCAVFNNKRLHKYRTDITTVLYSLALFGKIIKSQKNKILLAM